MKLFKFFQTFSSQVSCYKNLLFFLFNPQSADVIDKDNKQILKPEVFIYSFSALW